MPAERFPVEESHILMFARSIGDANPAYVDPASPEARAAGGVRAPPTFVQANVQFDEAYHARPKPGGAGWHGSGRNPSGAPTRPAGPAGAGSGGAVLHAEQHYEYHRPLKAGDVLTATVRPGATWEKQGRRAGSLVFSEVVTEFRDQDGELVVTARGVGVRTQKVVEAE